MEDNKVPYLSASLNDITFEMTMEQSLVAKLHQSALDDNKKVYFALIPKLNELVIPEKSKFTITEIPFKLPNSLPCPFFDNIQVVTDEPKKI